MAKRRKIVGTRTTRLKARKLERDFLRSRMRKPYRTFVVKQGRLYVVKVQEKK